MLNNRLTPADFTFKITLQVRWRDNDSMAHTNNAVYSTYLEEARLGYVKHLGFDYTKHQGQPAAFMLVETHKRFIASAVWGDVIEVYIKVTELKKSRFIFEYLIWRPADQKKLCVARTVQVGIDLTENKIVSLHPDFTAAIKNHENFN